MFKYIYYLGISDVPRTIFETAVSIISHPEKSVSVDTLAKSLKIEPSLLADFLVKTNIFGVKNGSVRMFNAKFAFNVFQHSNASCRKGKSVQRIPSFPLHSSGCTVICSEVPADICQTCIRIHYGETIIEIPFKLKKHGGKQAMVDLEFSLTAGVFNVRPLKVTTESKKNGLVTLVENGLKVIIEPKKKKKKAKQAIKKEKKNFPDPCLKAITPEELRWKVINFSMIQLCKKKDIPDEWLYRRFCRQIDEHVTEKTFKTYMSLQIFDCNYKCYSRKEDLVSLEEYLMSNPAVKV